MPISNAEGVELADIHLRGFISGWRSAIIGKPIACDHVLGPRRHEWKDDRQVGS